MLQRFKGRERVIHQIINTAVVSEGYYRNAGKRFDQPNNLRLTTASQYL
jgi:hypothetical protein